MPLAHCRSLAAGVAYRTLDWTRPRSSGTRAYAMAGRGAFIVFEGVDRSGKSTQAGKLADALKDQGVAAERWNFPDRKTRIGQTIDDYLKGKADGDDATMHLLFSANRWEKRKSILAKLQQGVTLVVDRYAYSGVAYTVAKQAPGLDLAWCKAPDQGLPAPDVVFYLQLDDATAAARAGFGEERYETPEIQQQVRGTFEATKDDSFVCLDASQTIDQLHNQVLEAAAGVIERCKTAPILQLWDRQPLPEQLQQQQHAG